MLTDATLQLSSAQAVTSTAVSVNTIDMGPQQAAVRDPMAAVITVDQSAVGAGATVQFQVVSSSAADLSGPTVLASSGAIGVADLVASRAPIVVETDFANMPGSHRYVGLRYLVAGGPLTAGKFSCALADDAVSVGKFYPGGVNVA